MIIAFVVLLTIMALVVTLILSPKFKLDNINEDILELLPKHNCNKCGFGCLGFTDDVIKDLNNLKKCPYISDNNKEEISALMRKKKKG